MKHETPHKCPARSREVPVPRALREWLRANPQAWAGWPSYDPCDPLEDRRRARRLEMAGCPTELAFAVRAAHQAIADLRLERRARLARMTAKTAWA